MSINDLAKYLGDACYAFLALNFLWGLYNILVGFRRLKQLSFRSQDEQAQYLDEVMEPLAAGRYEAVEQQTNEDARALPQLIYLAVANRELGYQQLRQVVTEVLQRDVMGDLEYRTNWVATVIKCGPLLGLFGTVLGMMAAFGRIGTGETVKPENIAAEISIALVCTAMGLATAIPFNFMLASMNTRVQRFQDALGAGLVRVLDQLKKNLKASGNEDALRGNEDFMEAASWEIGESGSEQLFTRRAKHVDPEFDITAMVDLVFMMNIYFLVTYVLVNAAGVQLPPAVNCSPLDPETAIVVTVTRSPDGKSIVLYLADNAKGEAIRERTEQDSGLQTHIAQGTSRGKKALLIKAEKNVRLGDMYRIATAATNDGLSLHVAVLEKAKP